MEPAETQSASRELLPKETLGGFSLVGKLAAGGMATVYLGHRSTDSGVPEFAAVKVMLPRLVEDTEYVEMFFDEARLTSAVKHPYVCKALAYGVEAGFHFLATEYVLGETWADVVEALHQTPEGRAVAPILLSHVAARACEGLHAVHEAHDDHGKHLGIVHRDVSPQNIMIGYDGSVYVFDFGIATARERLHETRNGVLKGHVAYMAPEQVQIQPVDRRSDLWPVGVMLWEGVTGRRLFRRADSRATMKAVTSDELTPLLRDCDGMNPSLLSIIERCVVRDPDGRFANALDMGKELADLSLGSTPVSSTLVASWMRHLFPKRFDEKRLLLKHAVSAPSEQSVQNEAVPAAAPEDEHGKDSVPAAIRNVQALARRTYRRASARIVSAVPPISQRVRWPLLLLALTTGGLALRVLSTTEPARASNTATLQLAPQRTTDGVPAKGDTAAKGFVEVRTSGTPVRVECEGRDLGLTPLKVELTPGRHQFRILPGGDDAVARADVVVESGEHYLMEIDRASAQETSGH